MFLWLQEEGFKYIPGAISHRNESFNEDAELFVDDSEYAIILMKDRIDVVPKPYQRTKLDVVLIDEETQTITVVGRETRVADPEFFSVLRAACLAFRK